ncbi:MAG: hypothetical protein ACYSWU_22240 [Planctomycetota bacterium]|jgi:hypothetical protein
MIAEAQSYPLTRDDLAALALDRDRVLSLVQRRSVSIADALAYLAKPRRAPKKPKSRKAQNGKQPAWTLDVLELKERFVPIWERETHKRQTWTKRTDKQLSAWIAEHPEWVAGRLVEKPKDFRVIYYSCIPPVSGASSFYWAWESRRKQVEKEPGFHEYATFQEWKEAQKPTPPEEEPAPKLSLMERVKAAREAADS